MVKKTKKKKTAIMGIFIVFVMVFSSFGIMFFTDGGTTEEPYDYNGFEIKKEGAVYTTTYNGNKVGFNYPPESVEKYNISPGMANILKNTYQVDFTLDLNDIHVKSIEASKYDMIFQLSRAKNVFLMVGYIKENEFNQTIITCDDATPTIPVIYFKSSNETYFETRGSCLIGNGVTASDFDALKDKILYTIYGIM